MLPTFLIIGAQKSGTTSLYELLAEHPEVGRASAKEVHYFDHNYERSLTWYQAHFPRCGEAKHTGESSPYYLYHPLCPPRVHAALPGVKLIVLLRDPVDRAQSHYHHERAYGLEPLDFAAAIVEEPRRLACEEQRLIRDPSYRSFAHQHCSYLSRGLYGQQLRRWYDYFAPEQFLILASEHLFANPIRILHQVQGWLDLPRHTPTTVTARNVRVYASMDPQLRAQLTNHFRQDAAQLSKLTDAHLPWVGS